MNDYIKREDAIEQARRNWTGEGEWIARTEINLLKNLKSADVRENIKGEWRSKMYECSRENHDQVFCCSVCGVSNDWRRTNFCPHCGADMRADT